MSPPFQSETILNLTRNSNLSAISVLSAVNSVPVPHSLLQNPCPSVLTRGWSESPQLASIRGCCGKLRRPDAPNIFRNLSGQSARPTQHQQLTSGQNPDSRPAVQPAAQIILPDHHFVIGVLPVKRS